MKTDFELNTGLEDLHFKYERMTALVSILQQYVSECVEVAGAPENAVSYSLYEIELGLMDANEKLKEIVQNGWVIRKEAASKTNE